MEERRGGKPVVVVFTQLNRSEVFVARSFAAIKEGGRNLSPALPLVHALVVEADTGMHYG